MPPKSTKAVAAKKVEQEEHQPDVTNIDDLDVLEMKDDVVREYGKSQNTFDPLFTKINETFLDLSNKMAELDNKRQRTIELMKVLHDEYKLHNGTVEDMLKNYSRKNDDSDVSDESDSEGEEEEVEVEPPKSKAKPKAAAKPAKKEVVVEAEEEEDGDSEDEPPAPAKKPAAPKGKPAAKKPAEPAVVAKPKAGKTASEEAPKPAAPKKAAAKKPAGKK